MAKKSNETPNGIICDTCGRDLPPSHYFMHRGSKDHGGFFITAKARLSNKTCFECAAPYKCLGCNEIKPASEFRIGGRYCASCRSIGINRVIREKNARIHMQSVNDSLEAHNAPEG
jgi:hypothetical protein